MATLCFRYLSLVWSALVVVAHMHKCTRVHLALRLVLHRPGRAGNTAYDGEEGRWHQLKKQTSKILEIIHIQSQQIQIILTLSFFLFYKNSFHIVNIRETLTLYASSSRPCIA